MNDILWSKPGRALAGLVVAGAMLVLTGFHDAANAEAQSRRRVALVVGNSQYAALDKLPNATNDAREVAQVLRKAGFDVTVGLDVDRLGLEQSIRTFLRSANDAEVGLLYYSGHGIQIGGENFILPVDATLDSAYDIETQTMAVDAILDRLQRTSRIQLIFLDACRNNPFHAQKYWMVDKLQPAGQAKGLARIEGNLGSLVAFSTAPGSVAYDGGGGVSPYTQYLVKYAAQPSREIRQVLTDVRRDVIAATGGRQVPWENSSLLDSFYFLSPPAPPRVEPMQQVNVAAGAQAFPLPLRAPFDEAGSNLVVTISEAPRQGRIVRGGAPIEKGTQLTLPELASLAYDSSQVQPGTVDVLGYTVSDPFGRHMPGLVAISVVADGSEQLTRDASSRTEKLARSKTYLESLPRDSETRIGVGAVNAGLPAAPQSGVDMAFRVESLPEAGVVSVGSRTLDLGNMVAAEELQQLAYEPAIGTEGRTFTLALAPDNEALPKVTVNFHAMLDDCDSEAAAPLDLQGVTAGRLPNEIDPKTAIPACEAASSSYPQVARFTYQLGRAELADRRTELAAKTFQTALANGHIRAADTLGMLYRLGALGKRDAERAGKIAADGALKGDPYALYAFGKALYYGQGMKADTKRGLRLMLRSAELGHTYAMNELGYIFLNGIKIDRDLQRGIRFYEQGMARQDIYSMNNLAIAYRYGRGVPQDLQKARDLFERAANGGQPYAPTSLGRMYRDGVGVPKDAALAIKWLELGAERGDYWGALDRARMAVAAGGDRDKVTAARYLALAIANERPGSAGDKDKHAVKELAALPATAKKKAEAMLLNELAHDRAAIPDLPSIDERLVFLSRKAWMTRNPRYDLF